MRQAAKKLAAGSAYSGSGYVLVDELGAPQRTDWLRHQTQELMAKVGVRRVRLYDARHACMTYLGASGVPDVIIAAWVGHADGGTLAKRVYIQPDMSHLKAAADRLDSGLFGRYYTRGQRRAPTTNRQDQGSRTTWAA